MALVSDGSGKKERAGPKEAKKNNKKKLTRAEREKKTKDGEIRALILEVLFYFVFLILLANTVSKNRDPQFFRYRRSTLSFIDAKDAIKKIKTTDNFWKWIHTTLLPFLYPTQDWNNDNLTTDARHVATFSSYKMGTLRIRQHRVRNDPCSLHSHFRQMDIRCAPSWSNSHMDSRNYTWSWAQVLDEDEWEVTGEAWTPWTYRSWSVVGGIPVVGVFGVYPSGGYIVDVSGDLQNAADTFNQLERDGWIDPMTRFVSVEFSLFCPDANLFATVPVIFEFSQAEIMTGKAHLYPFKLFSYLGNYPVYRIVGDVFVYLAIIWFCVREIAKIIEERCKYFTKVWNLLEFVNLILSLAAIILYTGRLAVTTYVANDLAKSEGQYYNFQTIALWDELFGILLGFVCFLSTLQMLNLLRFNRRMSHLAATLREAAKDLSGFSLVFIIVFLAFVSLSYITFGPNLIRYSSVIRSTETLITVALGQFDYYALMSVNRIIAPIFLFAYMMFIVFILINMLITILNDSFAVVREDASKQPNDYELIEYMIARASAFLWTFKPVRAMWGTARNAGIVKDEAPKSTQSPLEKPPTRKKNVRQTGVNFRPRNRHRCTFNADLVRLHNRLDNLNYLADHFIQTLEQANPSQKKKVSFCEKRSAERHSIYFSCLNESDLSSKEQEVPGNIKDLGNPSVVGVEQDNVVPATGNVSLGFRKSSSCSQFDDVFFDSSLGFFQENSNIDYSEFQVTPGFVNYPHRISSRPEEFNEAVVLDLHKVNEYKAFDESDTNNSGDQVVVDIHDHESSM